MNTALRNPSLEELDRQTVLHPFTPLKTYASGALGEPRIVESGRGIRIRDRKGRELIDGFAGLYCVNIGYGREEVAEAIHAQARKLAYYHTYVAHSTEALIRLSDRLVRMAPGTPAKVFYGLSGSDANETQVRDLKSCGRRGHPAVDRPPHAAAGPNGSRTTTPFTA